MDIKLQRTLNYMVAGLYRTRGQYVNCTKILNAKHQNEMKCCSPLHVIYSAKNNQRRTIWSAGKLPFTASENMFKVIYMHKMHNFRRN